jgi:HAD superfamily hydrolase (TIGR01484 family)
MILFFDLDGTLLNEQEEVHEEDIKKLVELRNKDWTLVIVTGRSFNLIPNREIFENLCSYIITHFGAVLRAKEEGWAPVSLQSFSSNELLEIFHYLNQFEHSFKTLSCNTNEHHFDSYSIRIDNITLRSYLIIKNNLEIEKKICIVERKLDGVYLYPFSLSKGKAIKFLSDNLDLNLSLSTALGNDSKDDSMYSYVSSSIQINRPNNNYVSDKADIRIELDAKQSVFRTLKELYNVTY